MDDKLREGGALLMQNILVTGAAGFIGSNFVRYLVHTRQDVRVTTVDLLTYAGHMANLTDLEGNPRHTFVQRDIADVTLVDKLMAEGFDAVINFAAESHVDRSITDPGVFVRTNVLGTQTLLDASRRYGVKRYVQISTDEVYGSLGPTGYFSEQSPLVPSSPYSASKASADLLVLAYGNTYGMHVNVTRCSNNYGPYQFPEKLIPSFITRALANQQLPLYGDGQNVRDWLHVEDHCRAIALVMDEGKPGEVYNVGGSNERTNLEITRLILRHLGKPESLIRFVADRSGHDRRYAIDASKIRHELGWKPRFTFDAGIVQTIDWYLQNQTWWKPLLP